MMDELPLIEILYDGESSVSNFFTFKPGDTISGVVRISLKSDKSDFQGIRAKCVGKSFTYWIDDSEEDKRKFFWKCPLFKQELLLYGTGRDSGTSCPATLHAGNHQFPFQFQLPMESLPPQMEEPNAWIRYRLKVIIDSPWKMAQKCQRFFGVSTVRDLNLYPNIMHSPSDSAEGTACCCCCESGPICMKGRLDKLGYAPGENINISLQVDNQSSSQIVSVMIKLIQKMVCRAKYQGTGNIHTKDNSRKITEVELPLQGCEAHTSLDVNSGLMTLPTEGLLPDAFDKCPNIAVSYAVEMDLDGAGCTPVDTKITIPIVIGTIPATGHMICNPPELGYPPQPGQPHHEYQPQPGQPHQGYQPQPGQPQQGHQPQPGQPHQGYPPQQGPSQAGYQLQAGQGYPAVGVPGVAAYQPYRDSETGAAPPSYDVAVGDSKKFAVKDDTFDAKKDDETCL